MQVLEAVKQILVMSVASFLLGYFATFLLMMRRNKKLKASCACRARHLRGQSLLPLLRRRNGKR